MKTVFIILCMLSVGVSGVSWADVAMPGVKNEKNTKSKITFEGGDGSSMEKAIIVKGAQSSDDGVPAEYQYLDKHFPGYELHVQRLLSNDDNTKYYDALTIKNQKGETNVIYFDITEFLMKNADYFRDKK